MEFNPQTQADSSQSRTAVCLFQLDTWWMGLSSHPHLKGSGNLFLGVLTMALLKKLHFAQTRPLGKEIVSCFYYLIAVY